jgi:hypothetical protein
MNLESEIMALGMGVLLLMMGFGLMMLSAAHSLIQIVPGGIISLIGGWGFCRIILYITGYFGEESEEDTSNHKQETEKE